jgi:hypothetical protein
MLRIIRKMVLVVAVVVVEVVVVALIIISMIMTIIMIRTVKFGAIGREVLVMSGLRGRLHLEAVGVVEVVEEEEFVVEAGVVVVVALEVEVGHNVCGKIN